jgi:hypothetical protein
MKRRPIRLKRVYERASVADGVRDEVHSHAVVLREALEECSSQQPGETR